MPYRRRCRPGGILVPLVALVLAAGTREADAQAFESVGTRALGMGGAFVAVVDDATACYWNPAGISTGAFLSLAAEQGRLESGGTGADRRAGRPASRTTATFVGLSSPALAFSYYRLGLVRTNRDSRLPSAGGAGPGGAAVDLLVTHHAAATLAQTIAPGLHVAASLKYVRGAAGSNGVPAGPDDPFDRASGLARTGTSRFDVDAGVIAQVSKVRVGLVGRNLRAPAFPAASSSDLALERQWRAGVAVLPTDRLTLAADADLVQTAAVEGPRRNVAAGVEAWSAGRRVGVRGGARVSTIGDSRVVGAGGVSVAVKSSLWVDAQLSRGGSLGDRSWTVSARFGF